VAADINRVCVCSLLIGLSLGLYYFISYSITHSSETNNTRWDLASLYRDVRFFQRAIANSERTEHLDLFLFSPITQWRSISDVLFTGGRVRF